MKYTEADILRWERKIIRTRNSLRNSPPKEGKLLFLRSPYPHRMLVKDRQRRMTKEGQK